MNKTARIVLSVFVLAFAAALAQPASAQITTYQVSGATGGTFPAAINIGGTVAGLYIDAMGQHGFLRAPDATITTFDDPSQDLSPGCSGCLPMFASTHVSAMNNAGAVVGIYYKASNPSGTASISTGFMRDPSGNFTDIAPAGAVFTSSQISINDIGEIAGSWFDSSDKSHGFVRDSSGNYTSFDVSGATFVSVASINSSGAIAGFYLDSSSKSHGFLRDSGGGISTFDPPTGFTGLAVYSMNDSEEITGYYTNGTDYFGFVTQGVTITSSLDLDAANFPQSINSPGTIVGYDCNTMFELCDGFVWNPPTTTADLTVLGASNTQPNSINDLGTISGIALSGSGPNFFRQGFVATPAAVSTPASGTTCNGTYNRIFVGNMTVAAGQSCNFIGGGITGSITITDGGDLSLDGSTVDGSIDNSGGSVDLVNSDVTGNVAVQGGGSIDLTDSEVGGNVSFNGGDFSFPVDMGADPSVIKGNLQIINLGASSSASLCGLTVQGNVLVENNAGRVVIGSSSPSCQGNTFGNNLAVQNNSAPTTVIGNQVGGNFADQYNTGATQVFGDTVKGNLQCQDDSSITGGGDTASKKSGLCAAF